MVKKDKIKIFIDEIYTKSLQKNYETNKTMIKSLDDTWSSDLLDDYGPKKTIEFIGIY